jgi:hypothetical protein
MRWGRLISWSRILLEKLWSLIIPRPLWNPNAYYRTLKQEPVTGPCPQPDEANQRPFALFNIHFNSIFPTTPRYPRDNKHRILKLCATAVYFNFQQKSGKVFYKRTYFTTALFPTLHTSLSTFIYCRYNSVRLIANIRSRDNVVGIATGYGLERQTGRSSSPGRVKNFLFFTPSRLALGPTQPPIQWVPGVLSPGVKRPGRGTGHSPPTSAKVNKMWIYISTSPYAFMA